jgi:hypothetical protein
MEQLKQRLASNPHVSSVQVNPRSGSVLVTGTAQAELQAALTGVLNVVQAVRSTHQPEEAAIETVVGVVREADKTLRRYTDGRLSIRWLIPATFVGVGLRQLLREGLTLGTVPWYVLIYYGVDSFLKLYPQHAPQPSGDRPDLKVVQADEPE